MSACDAVVVPSLKEGFGLAAIEAMALGRPVVATSVGGLTEIVSENQTGFLVPPNNPQALANALIDLLRDKSLADQMGHAGRERMVENFDLRKQMRKVYSILQEVA
jgi:glycosyltransferase involved in cell wall biosynthesis